MRRCGRRSRRNRSRSSVLPRILPAPAWPLPASSSPGRSRWRLRCPGGGGRPSTITKKSTRGVTWRRSSTRISLARLSSAIRAQACGRSSASAARRGSRLLGGVMRNVVLHRAQRAIVSGLLARLWGGFDGARAIGGVVICHSTSSARAELTPRNNLGPAHRKAVGRHPRPETNKTQLAAAGSRHQSNREWAPERGSDWSRRAGEQVGGGECERARRLQGRQSLARRENPGRILEPVVPSG